MIFNWKNKKENTYIYSDKHTTFRRRWYVPYTSSSTESGQTTKCSQKFNKTSRNLQKRHWTRRGRSRVTCQKLNTLHKWMWYVSHRADQYMNNHWWFFTSYHLSWLDVVETGFLTLWGKESDILLIWRRALFETMSSLLWFVIFYGRYDHRPQFYYKSFGYSWGLKYLYSTWAKSGNESI